MRGRIRTVKPEALKDEELWDLEVATGLPIYRAFQGLWMFADREGRFEWRPRALKSDILPYWEGGFEAVLDALVSKGFITRYSVDGRDYGLVPKLSDHQRFDHREPASVLPAPPFEEARPGTPGQSSAAPASDPGNARVEGKGREGKGIGRESAPGAPAHTPGSTSRVVTMPSEEPPKAYLDMAVMRGVSREQAAATWEHYWAAGLPKGGVEKLEPWLVKQAKERTLQLTTTARASPSRADPLAAQAQRVEMLRAREAEEAHREPVQ